MYGCTVLGTGGGGSLEVGLELVLNDFDNGKEFILVDLNEIPDDAYIASPYFCGAISPLTKDEIAKYANLPYINETAPMLAFKTLEKYYDVDFYGVLSTELGGGNTGDALHVAANLNKYILMLIRLEDLYQNYNIQHSS